MCLVSSLDVLPTHNVTWANDLLYVGTFVLTGDRIPTPSNLSTKGNLLDWISRNSVVERTLGWPV